MADFRKMAGSHNVADSPEEDSYMARALELARQGLNTTTPNPRVGCVIVSPRGEVVGEGYHQRAGEAHAEINALAAAGAAARGATAYVTLEPCDHHGRTGPCSEALLRAGITRVVYAMEDPNPRVSGRGLARLRAAGVEVDGPLLEAEARALNPGFIKRMRSGRPWVTLKLAMSLDGRTAMASGESKWLTGPSARAQVQALRARSCAIVTGAGTVLADDPALTVRAPELGEDPRQPLRVVLDRRRRVPPEAAVFTGPGPSLRATLQAVDARDWALPAGPGGIDLAALVDGLGARQCNEVLVETGPLLAGAFARAGLVDEYQLFVAPKLLGSTARPLLDWPLEHLADAPRLEILQVESVGADLWLRARPALGET